MSLRDLPIGLVAAALVASACGGSRTDPAAGLSPAAAAGYEVALDSGCTSCHGANGEGGAGPAWTGLVGTSRPLEDGTAVTADRDYLVRSITDPRAQQAQGYTIFMPVSNLTAAQVDSIVDYIEELS